MRPRHSSSRSKCSSASRSFSAPSLFGAAKNSFLCLAFLLDDRRRISAQRVQARSLPRHLSSASNRNFPCTCAVFDRIQCFHFAGEGSCQTRAGSFLQKRRLDFSAPRFLSTPRPRCRRNSLLARLPPSALARPSALKFLPPPSPEPRNSPAWNSVLPSAVKPPTPGG